MAEAPEPEEVSEAKEALKTAITSLNLTEL